MRRRRLLSTITVTLAALALASIPSATAHSNHRSDHAKGTPSEVAGEAAPAETNQSGGETGVSGAVTGQTPPPAHHSGSVRHDHSGGRQSGSSAPSTAGTGQEKGAGSDSQAQAKSGKGQGEGVPPLETERRRAKERAGKPAPAHVNRGKAKQIEATHASSTAAEGSPGSAEAPALPSPPAPSVTASAAGAPAPAPTTQPAQLGTAPATLAVRAQPKGRGRPARRRSAAAKNHATGTPAPSTSARLGAGAATPALARTTRPAKRAASHAKAHETTSPLARTITKIVGVVPTPVRVLIGALLALAFALAVRSRLIARRAVRLEHQRGQLLEDVGLLQAALLPVTPARLGPVGTTTAYRPAAGPAAGGDFYDVFALEDGQLAVIVGDVSGHGREALPHTALVRFTLRAYLEAGLSPRGAVQTAGAVLEHQLGGSFATVIAATYNPRERRLVYASAGHPPPVVIGTGIESEALEPVTVCSAPPLGVGMATGTRQSILSIPGAAQICFYTDGVTEARIGRELFGSQRLAQTLAEIGPTGDAAELLDRVSDQADRRPDDMAACLLNLTGAAAAPRGLIEEIELDRETVESERARQLLLACGVEASEATAVLISAARVVAREGSVVLELHRADGHARVTFQNNNLTYLQTRHAARQADRMVTL